MVPDSGARSSPSHELLFWMDCMLLVPELVWGLVRLAAAGGTGPASEECSTALVVDRLRELLLGEGGLLKPFLATAAPAGSSPGATDVTVCGDAVGGSGHADAGAAVGEEACCLDQCDEDTEQQQESGLEGEGCDAAEAGCTEEAAGCGEGGTDAAGAGTAVDDDDNDGQ